MARKLSLKQARRAALRGQTDAAITALQAFAEADDAGASASLAELFAFRGRWDEVIVHAGRLIFNPSAVYAGNVFYDMVGLLGRAGHETGQWQRIAEAAVSARNRSEQTEEREHLRIWHCKILKCLEDYALLSGDAPEEMIRVFGVITEVAPKAKKAYYQKAAYEAQHHNEEFQTDQAALSSYLFAIARNYGQNDELMRIYDNGGMPANFDNAVYMARALVDRGESERAWEALREHISLWWPVDWAQVAPVILLTDLKLCGLMSRERCEQVLSLPRGSEAEKAPTLD